MTIRRFTSGWVAQRQSAVTTSSRTPQGRSSRLGEIVSAVHIFPAILRFRLVIRWSLLLPGNLAESFRRKPVWRFSITVCSVPRLDQGTSQEAILSLLALRPHSTVTAATA